MARSLTLTMFFLVGVWLTWKVIVRMSRCVCTFLEDSFRSKRAPPTASPRIISRKVQQEPPDIGFEDRTDVQTEDEDDSEEDDGAATAVQTLVRSEAVATVAPPPTQKPSKQTDRLKVSSPQMKPVHGSPKAKPTAGAPPPRRAGGPHAYTGKDLYKF